MFGSKQQSLEAVAVSICFFLLWEAKRAIMVKQRIDVIPWGGQMETCDSSRQKRMLYSHSKYTYAIRLRKKWEDCL
jgi:hypothetical protein